jgi:hypothetical protein
MRIRHRWEGYTKMNHKETGCESKDWIHKALGSFSASVNMENPNEGLVLINARYFVTN